MVLRSRFKPSPTRARRTGLPGCDTEIRHGAPGTRGASEQRASHCLVSRKIAPRGPPAAERVTSKFIEAPTFIASDHASETYERESPEITDEAPCSSQCQRVGRCS